ncbi:MAG: hypothetical protein WC444_04375 [Candidatus Paceibacterota bacterium]
MTEAVKIEMPSKLLVLTDEDDIKLATKMWQLWSVVHEAVWGDFYMTKIKHGECDEKTRAAYEEYRDFIFRCLEEHGIDINE